MDGRPTRRSRGKVRQRAALCTLPLLTLFWLTIFSCRNNAEKAWRKSREALKQKLGPESMHDTVALEAKGKEIFGEFDADRDGNITPIELKTAMARAGVDLKQKEVNAMVLEADEDGCGPSTPWRASRAPIFR